MIALHVLASGSRGNAAVIENTQTHEGVLVDCGICKRDLIGGCTEVGFDPANIKAILITHDHSDHTKGLGVVLRGLAKGSTTPTVYVSERVRNASKDIKSALTSEVDVRPMSATDALTLAGMQVHVFRTSHDAAESFGFRFEWSGTDDAHKEHDALGFMTDTGVVLPEAHEALEYVRILALESNHDLHMLHNGPYPYPLKKRVASNLGHLSNDQAAAELDALMQNVGSSMLEHVVAMHISQNNNTYALPKETLKRVIERIGHSAEVRSAFQSRIVSVR